MRKRKLTPEQEQEAFDIIASSSIRTNPLLSLKIDVKCKTKGQKVLLESIKNNIITICSGRAGSGKTYIAIAQALKMMKLEPELYRKIILIKSVIPLKNEEVGFLKGNLKEKIGPFIDSFIDNFDQIIGRGNFNTMEENGFITVLPIAFARGRSLNNAIIIIDEAQNIDYENMRTLMTRIGMCDEKTSSKMIILGDVKQKDLKNKKSSSLEQIIDIFDGLKDFGTVKLYSDDDFVRNPIIKIIEEKFDNLEESKK
jgi:phosphate starvation-inducible PhoH-like protein